MAGFLKKLKKSQNPEIGSCKISISSRPVLSDQTTKLDEQSGTPIIAPLDTLEQVLAWQPGSDELCTASIPLCRKGRDSPMDDPSAQKMIVCHDMMGGYVKDKFPQGVRDLEDYYFYHWQHIEAFIYFSHHFITIPPPSWSNAAHRHGVLSMGTLITEWEGGARLCHSLLQNEFKVMELAQQLVAIAQYYGFDGWLINIENPIHPMLLDQLSMFLSLVTTGMHDSCPGSKVIWYDSVTTEGKLKWQNMLNQMNYPYFDTCDGIFLNYNWTESGLRSSRMLAKERKGELYVGIDVFGRGCPGGGGYNSCEALEAIHKSGLSSALFAPGWVFENQDKRRFFEHENRFWSLLQPWLNITPISSLPLVSSFGRGCGYILAIDGQVVYNGEWANHSAQDVQPSFCTESSIQNDTQSAVVLERVYLDHTTAFNNGVSLRVEGTLKDTTKLMSKPSLLRLFKTNLSLSDPLLVAYTYKRVAEATPPPPQPGYRYFIQFHTSGSPSRIFLDPLSTIAADDDDDEQDGGSPPVLSKCGLPISRDVPHFPGCVLAPLSPRHSRVLDEIFTGGSVQDASIWKTCYFVVDREELRDKCIEEITLGFYCVAAKSAPPSSTTTRPPPRRISLNIGELKVLNAHCLSPKSDISTISNICCHDFQFSDDPNRVSFTLSWHNTSRSNSDPVDHCNIYSSSIISEGKAELSPWKSEHVFLGRAYTNCYRVTDLYLLTDAGADAKSHQVSFELHIQPVTVSRRKPAIKDSQAMVLHFEP